jgi:hypothetical protein
MKQKRERVYLIRCNWCGAKIREGKERDNGETSSSLCLKCFYRTLSKYLRTQKRAAYGDFVSDR